MVAVSHRNEHPSEVCEVGRAVPGSWVGRWFLVKKAQALLVTGIAGYLR